MFPDSYINVLQIDSSNISFGGWRSIVGEFSYEVPRKKLPLSLPRQTGPAAESLTPWPPDFGNEFGRRLIS